MRTNTFTIEVQFTEWSDIVDRKLKKMALVHGEILPGLIVTKVNNMPKQPNQEIKEHISQGATYGSPKDIGYVQVGSNGQIEMPNITV